MFDLCRQMAKTLHVVYTTNWKVKPGENFNMSRAEWNKKLASMSTTKRKIFLRSENGMPNCCDFTKPYFREVLVREARRQGFEVVRWPIRSREDWLAVGEAARTGQMAPGAAAILCHSWHGNYEKECVPAWDYYPVFEAVKSVNNLIYPHPGLDQLHSEKRYKSALMPPTRYIHFVRQNDVWKVKGQSGMSVKQTIAKELKKLEFQASAKGLPFKDIMVKQGLSWGGYAVSRIAPTSAQEFIMDKMLPKLPKPAQKVTVLLQAKLDVLSELRQVMVEGKLRGAEWKSLNEPKRGSLAVKAGYQDKRTAQDMVEKLGKESGKFTMEGLKKKMGEMCKQVYAEAVADAHGAEPLYMRVDILLDKQSRLWLGERESYGADLNGNDEFIKMDPTLKEMSIKMVTKAKQELNQLRSTKKVKKHTLKNSRRNSPESTRRQSHSA